FVRVDAPDFATLDPPGHLGRLDAAPGTATLYQTGEDTRLGAGNNLGSRVGLPVECPDAAFDDDTALAGHHALVHPALGSLPAANHPPVFEFSDDLDGHLPSGEHPLNGVGLAGTNPQVHKIRA